MYGLVAFSSCEHNVSEWVIIMAHFAVYAKNTSAQEEYLVLARHGWAHIVEEQRTRDGGGGGG